MTTMMYENHSQYSQQQEIDEGHQESPSNMLTCEVSSTVSSSHLSNTCSSTTYSSSGSGCSDAEADIHRKSNSRKITKQHKSTTTACQQSPNKKKKRSLIGEIVMNSTTPINPAAGLNSPQVAHTAATSTNTNTTTTNNQQTQSNIVFESFEGRKSSSLVTASHIPGTFSFSHKIVDSSSSCNFENQQAPQSNMCEVILSNWKSRSDTRQWIKKCIGPAQEKKKRMKKKEQSAPPQPITWCQSSSSNTTTTTAATNAAHPTAMNQFCPQPQPQQHQVVVNNNKFDNRKVSNNNMNTTTTNTTNNWSDSYIHTTCLIPGQRKVAKSSSPSASSCHPTMTPSVHYSHDHHHTTSTSSSAGSLPTPAYHNQPNTWSNTSNSISNVAILPSFREFVSTLGL